MRWRYRDTVLALLTLAFFVTMVGRLAISPVVPAIIDEFRVSNAIVGAALTGMWLAYGLTQFPSGILADRFGERGIILIAVGGTAVMGLLVAVAPVFGVFFVGTVLLGAVAGLHYSVATAFLSRTYDDVGTAIGIHNNGGTLAGLLTPIVVAWIAVRYGWRPAVAIVAVVGIPVFVLILTRVRPTPPRHPETSIRDRLSTGGGGLLTRPTIAFTLVLAIVTEFAWQGTASFLPTFLIEHHALSTTIAGVLFSIYFVAQGVGQVGVGLVTDRLGTDRTLAGCMAVGAIGYGLLVGGPGIPTLVAGATLVGVGMSFGPAIMPRFLYEMDPDERATGFGLVRTVYMIGASAGSVVLGLLADHVSWSAAFGLLAVLSVLVVAALLANRVLRLGW